MNKPILASMVILAVIAAAIIFYAAHHSGNDRDFVRISGNIEVTTVAVSFKIPGRVEERLKDEGEMVSRGDLVARLDSRDLAHEEAIRKAEVQAARSALNELTAGSRSEEIAQARAVQAAADAEAGRLAYDFKRQKELFAREVIPQQKYEAAKAAQESSQAVAAQAREALALVRKGPRRERIDQARARLAEAEGSLALARERFGYALLTAPVAGMVMAKHVEAGEQVAAGTPVVTVGLMENVWVRAYIAETDLGRVKVGQKAVVRTDAYPGKAYDGRISFISSEAEFTPKNVQTQKERVKLVYRIKITIPNPNMELKPGMPADAEILLK